MSLDPINPQDIQRVQNQPQQSSARLKSMEFGDIMGGVSAMTPFATEFTSQATGSVNAATVLNAAFSSFPGAAASFAGAGAGGAPSWSSAGYSSPYGAGGYSSYQNGIPGLSMTNTTSPASNNQAVPGTNMSQAQLMETMNQNNLQLIELQAMMQSNMQVWNTKSNILSADHRAKMSMIEKFTARG